MVEHRDAPSLVRMRASMDADGKTMTVYFDGSCPLCRLEISYYRAQEGAEGLRFVDVSDPESDLGAGLARDTALSRFHVRDQNGALISGASGFAAIWRRLPRWWWAAHFVRLPGVLQVLEVAYRAFLYVRPILARAVARRLACSPGSVPAMSSKSGYFQTPGSGQGQGTERQVDRKDQRGASRCGGADQLGRDGGQDLPFARRVGADVL